MGARASRNSCLISFDRPLTALSASVKSLHDQEGSNTCRGAPAGAGGRELSVLHPRRSESCGYRVRPDAARARGPGSGASGTARSEFADGAGGRGALDRKSVVSGKSVSVRVDLGGRRIINKKSKTPTTLNN